jgi:ABC-type nitrate/sulfonate/bicarbonate transport system substrate-binding protein
MNHKITSALLGAVTFAMAQNASAAAEVPTIHYSIGQYFGPISQLPLAVAERKGFFAREGVKVEVKKATEGNAGALEKGYIPSIEHGGPADITSIPNGQFIEVVLNGSDGVAVAAQHSNPVNSIVVRPEIKTWADLKGKQLTFTAPWDNITLAARELLRMHGLGPNDYTFISIGGTEGRMACLKSGKCAAVTIGQPSDIDAVKMGFRRLGYTAEAGRMEFNLEVVRRGWAEQNRDTLVRYLRADAAALRFIHDPKNHAEVTKILSDLSKEPDDVVNEMMANIQDPKLYPLTRNAELDVKGFQHVLDLIKAFKLTDKPLPPAAHFIDLSYAKAAGIQ